MTLRIALTLSAALALAACGGETETDYDPSWGEGQFVSDGKADLIDLAEVLEYGDSAEGAVTSSQMDLYKLAATNGDKFEVTMRTLQGDLAPDASLFRSSGGSVSSSDFSVNGQTLVKQYVAGSTTTYLIAARAFRNQGAGDYKLTIKCTGGPCNGEFLDPVDPITEVDPSDIVDCLDTAFSCSFDDLPRWNGRVGETRAANIFNTCLSTTAMWDGTSCEDACDHSDDAQDLCGSIVKSLPFYADQSTACLGALDSCMSDCTDLGDGGFSDEIWESPLAMCFENGFNSTCDSFAREQTVCGGSLQNETAVCYSSCYASSGVWMDDLDTICEDDCGRCGVQCMRELDWGPFIPSDGLVGDIVDSFMGEVDPFVLGDVCITYVQVYEVGDGELPPGIYGLVEDLDTGCNADDHSIGEGVHATMNMLEELVSPDAIDAASSAGAADRFYFINGLMEHVD